MPEICLLQKDKKHPENIVLFNEDNAELAIKKLFQIAHDSNSPANTAIWMNAGLYFSEYDQIEFAQICDLKNLNIIRHTVSRSSNLSKDLSSIFNKQANLSNDKCQKSLLPVQNHISIRIEQLQTSFPDRDVYLTLRSEISRTASEYGGNPHIDGGSYNEERFIETLYGESTCFFSNEDVEYGYSFESIKLNKKEPVYFKAPQGSLSIITSLRNSNRPVMHTAPPVNRNVDKDLRVVAIYDLKKKKKDLMNFLSNIKP
jgi:hypothetical protein